MTANRFKDINNAFAPISFLEEKLSARRNIKCHITDNKIEKGEKIYHFKLFNLDTDVHFYAKKNAFENSDYYTNYKNHYLTNNYAINNFKNYDYFSSLKFIDVINEFSFNKALKLIITPEKVTNEDATINDDVTTLLSIIVKCGFSNRLLENLSSLPKTSLLLFALLDDNRFQEKVSKILEVPLFKTALNIIRKKKLNLQDFNFLIEFSSKNIDLIKLLASSLEKYNLHYLYSRTTRGCFNKLNPINHCRLIYFFIMQPELLPLYNGYLTKLELPIKNGFDSSIYMECYYYRASMFYIVKNNPSLIESWISAMPSKIAYYHSGSPKAFINESIKMIKHQLTKNKSH